MNIYQSKNLAVITISRFTIERIQTATGLTHILVHATYISYKCYLHLLEYEIGVAYIFLRFYRSQLKNACSLISLTLCVIVGRTVHLLYELQQSIGPYYRIYWYK